MATVSRAPVATYGSVMDEDNEALFACADYGGSLCTVVGIDGSWSRRLGAELAVLPNGVTKGSLADGCLEVALAAEIARDPRTRLWRIGKGSELIDFRLPCGSGINLLLEPEIDHSAVRRCTAELVARRPARRIIRIKGGPVVERAYIPSPRLLIMGRGPEVSALTQLCHAAAIECVVASPFGDPIGDGALVMGRAPGYWVDEYTAIVVLFHDHEWERDILPWALTSQAFYVGAQGGKKACENRLEMLRRAGCDADAITRLVSPIGRVHGAKTPLLLALSILTDIMFGFEALRPPLRIVEG